MQQLIAAFDVGYHSTHARAAVVVFSDWTSARPEAEYELDIFNVADYEPGQFYKRELPCLTQVIATMPTLPTLLVVDSFVDLAPNQPGLGAHLFAHFDETVPVIGVAKTFFATATHAIELFRGGSRRPLYITAAGIEAAEAAQMVASMHGPHRVPTLLKRVDRLSRIKC